MRALIVSIALLVLAVPTFAADQADTPATRREAATRYAKVADLEKMLTLGLEVGAQRFPSEERAAVVALFKKHLRIDAIEELMVASLVKNFTTAELDALATFYSSGPGKSAMEKMAPFMQTMMPVLQAEIMETVKRVQEEMRLKATASGT